MLHLYEGDKDHGDPKVCYKGPIEVSLAANSLCVLLRLELLDLGSEGDGPKILDEVTSFEDGNACQVALAHPLTCGCTTAWLVETGQCFCDEHDQLVADLSDMKESVARRVDQALLAPLPN